MKINLDSIQQMEQRVRANFINSLSGFKSASLIGTADARGRFNLALFSSVIHVGAHPPLVGLLFRPPTVPRHTYDNIRSTGWFTVNHVHEEILRQAHQTSARYGEEVSEFEAAGLTAEVTGPWPAPSVRESRVRYTAEYVEEYPILANGTVFVVGRIVEVEYPDEAFRADGYLDIEAVGTVAISGLDSYHRTVRIERMAYAKPDRPPIPLVE